MVWVDEQIKEKLLKIDTLVLDIDGVLVAVGESFRQAIAQGVEFYLHNFANCNGHQLAILPEETEFFKLAGGFNNDWDLALAVVLLYLCKQDKVKSNDLAKLRTTSWSVEEYAALLAKAGGGLQSVEKVLKIKIDQRTKKQVADICKEIYAGEEFYAQLYKGKIKYVQGSKSLIHQEIDLLKTTKLLQQKKQLAILTGRNWLEAKLVLDRLGLLEHIPREHILTDDDGLHKPNPATLNCLGARLGTSLGLFVGDTLDDLRTTKGTKGEWLSACLLSGGTKDEQIFRQAGADLIASDINSLLDFLKGEKQ